MVEPSPDEEWYIVLLWIALMLAFAAGLFLIATSP